MKKLVIVLSIIVVVAGVTWLIIYMNKKPKVVLDANGFPINPKNGDTFTKDGKVFTFNNGVWTTDSGGSGGNGGGTERLTICGQLQNRINQLLNIPRANRTTKNRTDLRLLLSAYKTNACSPTNPIFGSKEMGQCDAFMKYCAGQQDSPNWDIYDCETKWDKCMGGY